MFFCIHNATFQSSYHKYLNQTSLSYSSGVVSSIEKLNCSKTVQCYADGYNDNNVEQLKYLSDRFGPVSSWSSAYRTDTWNLSIARKSGKLSACMLLRSLSNAIYLSSYVDTSIIFYHGLSLYFT